MARKPASKRRPKASRNSSAKRPSAPSPRRKPRAPAPSSADAGQNIRVRMYRVGFGDCFLLSLPIDGSSAHILVDCGVHSQGDIGTMQQIVEDVADQTGKRLALVVATHRHQDHISGFGRYEREFKQFKVGEVWLPWTEDPKDPHAKQLKEKHFALASMLQMHLEATGTRLDDGTPEARALFAVLNAAGNAEALRLLASGINGGTVRYLDAGRTFKDAAGIPGLNVQVLGPPRDKKFLSKMDPPSGDRFLRLNRSGKAVPANELKPFEKNWRVDAKVYRPFDTKALKEMVDTSAALAFALDQVLNNTSLVTLFSYRGKNLLFPGDAQYGNWQSWMKSPNGEFVLEHVDFFKIAHHGSHNATPKSALDKMHGGFAAMISTQNRPWPSIPFEKMLNRLEQKASGVVRSDSITVAGAKKAPKGPKLDLGPGFSVGPFWCDYTLAL